MSTEQFDMYATPEVEGDWEYELDDSHAELRKGPWPFPHVCTAFCKERQKHVTWLAGIRLAPNSAYQSWRTQYVLLRPNETGTKANATINVFKRRQGLGGWIDGADVEFDLTKGTFRIGKCDSAIRSQVRLKAKKILAFIILARSLAKKGADRIQTAHERYNESRTQKGQ